MAVDLGSETVTVSKTRRSHKITIECPLGQDYVLVAQRELVQSVAGTVIAKDKAQSPVSRGLTAVASQQVTLSNGKVVTPADLAEAIAAFIDIWESQDNTSEE